MRSEVPVVVAERGKAVLISVDELLTERTFARDALTDEMVVVERRDDTGEGAGLGRRQITAATANLAAELLSRARKVESDRTAGRHTVSGSHVTFFVNDDLSAHRACFVLADVNELVFTRLYPVALPPDVVALGITGFGSPMDSVRFFSELACIYRDAVRLGRQSVRIDRELLGSLRAIASGLAVALGSIGVDEGGYRTDAAEGPSDGPDPCKNVRHDDVTPSARDVAGSDSAPVAGGPAKNPEPATGGLNTQKGEEA